MQVNIYNAKTHLSDLVNRAVAGEEIIIARDGKPMVKLTPANNTQENPFLSLRGALEGQFEIPPDFDAPMPEEWFDFPKPWENQ